MKNIKLNKLVKNQLSEKEMQNLVGGEQLKQEYTLRYIPGYGYAVWCGCGCIYASEGGSSTSDNSNANTNGHLFTYPREV